MSPRWNWDTPNPVPLPQNRRGGGHTRLRVSGWGSPNSDDWRKSLALCPTLCPQHTLSPIPSSVS